MIGTDAICSASLLDGLSAMSHSTLECICFLNFRVWVAQPRQIRGPGSRILFLKQAVIPVFSLQQGNLALGIVDVSKHDRFRRAGLLARGDNLTIAYGTILFFGFDF